MSPLAIIVTNVPPTVCGVGDYNARLLAGLQLPGDVTCLVPPSVPLPDPPLVAGHAVRRLAFDAPLPATDLLVHYSAFGYAPRGYPRWLLRAVEHWRSEHPDRRLSFMLHELWDTAAEGTWRAPIEWLHRRHFLRVLARADGILTNTTEHVRRLHEYAPQLRVDVQPVASNIPVPSAAHAAAREPGLAVIFGMQGSRVRTLEALGAGLRAQLGNGRLRRLVLVGGGAHPRWAPREEACLAALPARAVERHAWMPADQLAALLAGAEFGLCETEWKDWGKSTVFMTYASHGLNILSPHARTQSEAPFGWLTHLDDLAADPASLAPRAAALQSWYRGAADWPQLLAAYRRLLGVEVATVSP
ncbi:MAG: hypothetical protein JSR82_15845 [Verrucomicrobia bacterium]|nr:hypothetical protein [Verrucomicrobiota bacterium]